MEWLTQYGIWVLVIVAAVVLFRRMGHRGSVGYHGFGTHGDSAAAGEAQAQGNAAPLRAPQAAVDPVSGNAFKTEHAITSYYRDRVYFFENEETRRRFDAEPERFATSAGGVDARPAEERHQHRRHGCC